MFLKKDSNRPPGAKEPIRIVPLLPLRDIIVFPYMTVPLFVGREKSINALERATDQGREIFLSAQKKAKMHDPAEGDVFELGTLGTIIQVLRLPDGTVKALVEGQHRARIKRYVKTDDYFLVEVEEIDETGGTTVEVEALVRSIKNAFEAYVKLN